MSKNVIDVVEDLHRDSGVPVDVILGYGPGELRALADRLRVEADLRLAVDTHRANVAGRRNELLLPVMQAQGFAVAGDAIAWILDHGSSDQKSELAWLALPQDES